MKKRKKPNRILQYVAFFKNTTYFIPLYLAHGKINGTYVLGLLFITENYFYSLLLLFLPLSSTDRSKIYLTFFTGKKKLFLPVKKVILKNKNLNFKFDDPYKGKIEF